MREFFRWIFVFAILLSSSCFAGRIPLNSQRENVSIIYIHGLNSFKEPLVQKNAADIAAAFKGKIIGNYVFDGKYQTIFWSDLFYEDEAFRLYSSGLLSINTAHNKSPQKNTISYSGNLLNPFIPLLYPSDKGSGSVSIFYRNLLNDYLYQVLYVHDNPDKQTLVAKKIQNAINQINGKYIIVAHSFGASIGIEFIEDAILNDKYGFRCREKNSKNFVGIITSGDINNTFKANGWSKQICGDNYYKTNNIIKYIIDNDKFWICYNHRNDIIASNLPYDALCHNIEGTGFVVSKTTSSTYLNALTSFFKLFSFDNSKFKAHTWMQTYPANFAQSIIKAYDEQTDLPIDQRK